MRKTGTYETLGNVTYFIPNSLPPNNPPLRLDPQTMELHGQAMLHLGKLNEMTQRIPNIKRFIKAYVNKEALLSSEIEGVNTTLLNLYTQPLLATKPDKNTQLVLNYTEALYKTLADIQEKNLPIVSRVILAAHKELMQNGEGEKSAPGSYRKQAVRVGNLIPAPAKMVPELMSDLEKYINVEDDLPALIKAGLAHVQFETIHPFLDGNGRIGRMLIVLMLVQSAVLSEPIIYPSYYFKKRNMRYYQTLDAVRTDGDFEGWIRYYLSVIKDSSIDAYKRAKDIEELEVQMTATISESEKLKKGKGTRLKAISILFNHPVIDIQTLSSELDVSYNTANKIITDFMELGFLMKQTEQKRGKLFQLKPYFEILEREYQ